MSGETPVETSRKTARTKADWFSAAEDVLVAEGVEAIRIDHLCQQLDVTKGSFYWHFENRADFVEQLLELWHREYTANVPALIEAGGGTGREKFSRLVFQIQEQDLTRFDLPIRRFESTRIPRLESTGSTWCCGRRQIHNHGRRSH